MHMDTNMSVYKQINVFYLERWAFREFQRSLSIQEKWKWKFWKTKKPMETLNKNENISLKHEEKK